MSEAQNHDLYLEHAYALLSEYNLDSSWRVSVSPNMWRRLGTCNFDKKLIRLSESHVRRGSFDQVMDTIRHEVAHALARQRFGQSIKPHGPEWKAIARELGATPRASVPMPSASVTSRVGRGQLKPTPKPEVRRSRSSFYAEQLNRSIVSGDRLSYQGKTYSVVATKRTRFTGVADHDGQTYSIPASLMPRFVFL